MSGWSAAPDGDAGWVLEGTLDAPDLGALAATLGPAPGRLDLTDLELANGVTVAALVTLLRGLARGGRLTICGAPQLLAHTLYKVGDLALGEIVLESVRADEPTTAN